MGPRAIGIDRQELLTPPEFRGLESRFHPTARVGGARIELIRDGRETKMGTCYQQIPVRVMPPFSFESEPAALLYLINLTAGLMDGDGHRIEVTARPGVNAVVTGQSATRIHPALVSFASQQWDVLAEDDSCVVVLPGPAIPFKGCRYYQRARVNLAPSAKLIWGDIWVAGRYDRGELSERFQFDRIVQDFEVRRAGKLIYRERFRWDGPWTPEDVAWHFGGHLATGSLLVAGPMPELPELAEGSLRRVVSSLDTGVSCIRWCGHPTALTNDLAITALTIAGHWTGGPGSPPWLLSSGDLSPNHWFSPTSG